MGGAEEVIAVAKSLPCVGMFPPPMPLCWEGVEASCPMTSLLRTPDANPNLEAGKKKQTAIRQLRQPLLLPLLVHRTVNHTNQLLRVPKFPRLLVVDDEKKVRVVPKGLLSQESTEIQVGGRMGSTRSYVLVFQYR